MGLRKRYAIHVSHGWDIVTVVTGGRTQGNEDPELNTRAVYGADEMLGELGELGRRDGAWEEVVRAPGCELAVGGKLR